MKKLQEEINLLETNVYSMLLMALGFIVDERHYIRDQDDMNIICFNNHNLIEKNNGRKYRNDIFFNPVHNLKMMESLVSLYFKKKREDLKNIVKVFFVDQSTGCAHVRLTDNGSGYISDSFPIYPSLGYIEIILTDAFGELSKISVHDLHHLEELLIMLEGQ